MASKLPDISTLLQAGINPKTGLPIRYDDEKCELKQEIKTALTIMDEQNAINRYVWYNLPNGLTGQMIERILYYKGQAMFFYMERDNTFYFLPYALDGTIDVYGRFMGVTPLPFNGSAQDKKDAWITGLTRAPLYELSEVEEPDYNEMTTRCVLLHDYSIQISQTNIPRGLLQSPIIDAMSEAFPFARTNLIANCGITGWRVNDQNDQANVELASKSILKSALQGKPWMPVVSSIEFQELTGTSTATTDAALQYMQALDNFRLSLLGLKNGGLFEKDNEYVNTTTASTIQANVGQVYQDGLTNRQRFCDFVNHLWGLGISVEPSETVPTPMDPMEDGLDEGQPTNNTQEGEDE